jgi:hypothetical protein
MFNYMRCDILILGRALWKQNLLAYALCLYSKERKIMINFQVIRLQLCGSDCYAAVKSSTELLEGKTGASLFTRYSGDIVVPVCILRIKA